MLPNSDPSFISPSPTTTKVLNFSFFNLAARLIPTAIGNPCPSDPVEASTPGILFFSGCPPKIELGLQMFLK